MIQKIVGGDLFEINTTKKYPEHHYELIDVAKVELRNNERPSYTEWKC